MECNVNSDPDLSDENLHFPNPTCPLNTGVFITQSKEKLRRYGFLL